MLSATEVPGAGRVGMKTRSGWRVVNDCKLDSVKLIGLADMVHVGWVQRLFCGSGWVFWS